MPRRRLSSDGLNLFNVAYPIRPKKSTIQNLLSCFFRTDYDDNLETMVKQCRMASKQLFSYHSNPILKNKVPMFIDNSIYNIIYAILSKDEHYATKFEIKQNYRYFKDVMEHARKTGDHNTVLMLYSALNNYSLKQLCMKERKKDKELDKFIKEEYGTHDNNFKKHIQYIIETNDLESIIPSMIALKLNIKKYKQYNEKNNLLESKIGMYSLQYITDQYTDALPLYGEPKTRDTEQLTNIANQAF